jgi:DNA-binding transcriptional LysR family regulator
VGARVLERSTRIEEDVAGVVRLAEAGNRAVSGLVRITAVSAIIGEYLVPRLPGLYALHPDLAVELIASNDNLSVARREADIAIRLARPASGDFLIRKLADVGFALYGAARGDLPVRRRLGGLQPGSGPHAGDAPPGRHARHGRVRLRSNSLRGLARAVADGIGHGILPCFMADPDPALVRLGGPEPVLIRELWMLIHPDARPRRGLPPAPSGWWGVSGRSRAISRPPVRGCEEIVATRVAQQDLFTPSGEDVPKAASSRGLHKSFIQLAWSAADNHDITHRAHAHAPCTSAASSPISGTSWPARPSALSSSPFSTCVDARCWATRR